MKKINKKESRNKLRRITEKAVIRDEQNSRIAFAAENPVGVVLEGLNTALTGLSEDEVTGSRSLYGSNRVTREKKKSLPKRLIGAFINPFTAILLSGCCFRRNGYDFACFFAAWL